MKLGNRMPVDVGVVLVAGLTMALAGCTPGAMTLAALSAPAAAPVAAASAPQSVGAYSSPSVEVVAEHSAPVAAYSAPAYCLDFSTPNGRMTVGDASAPQCIVINAASVAGHSARRRGQRAAVRRRRQSDRRHAAMLRAQRPPRRPRPSRSRIMPSSRPSLPRSRKRSSTAISRL